MKKMISAFLAIVMCAALAVPVLAEDPANDTTTYDVDLEVPKVLVSVPSTSAVILNPYMIAVENDDVGSTNSQGSVLAAEMYLANKSNVPLLMSMVVTGSIPDGSKAAFATAAPAAEEKNKKVFMFVDVSDVVEDEAPSAATLSNVTRDESSTMQCVVKSGDVKLTNVQTITVPDDADKGNYVTISIGGSCSTTPTEAWTKADKVGLKMVFTFQASNNTASGS